MSIVKKHIQHLEKLKETIEEQAKKIIVKNMDYIISVLENKQLGLGLNSKGGALAWSSGTKGGTGFYTENTELIAKSEFTVKPKIAGEPYNFQWTGSFFNSLGLKTLSRNKYSIFSTDGKAAFIRKAYGDVLTLTEKSNDWVNKHIIEPELVEHIEENWWRLTT